MPPFFKIYLPIFGAIGGGLVRLNRNRLNIGTYCLQPYARTPAHIQDLAACGIDFVIGIDNDRGVLDLFSQYGIGAVVSGIVPGWFGGLGENAGTMWKTNHLGSYTAAAEKFCDHPAIWGIDVGDEPSARDFPHYGKAVAAVNEAFANQFAYLNLYPSYGMLATNTPEAVKNQLGTDTYEEYIAQYCQYVKTDYICCDYYPYSCNTSGFYENLRIVSDACRKNKRQFWIVLQVNSHREDVILSTNQLRFQAYTAMAFGAEVISWACYTAGWWHHQVLDSQGNKTEQYTKLQCVNREIHTIADAYMCYRNVATHFIGKVDWLQRAAVSFSTDRIINLREENDLPLVIGEMVSREQGGGQAVMLCPIDDPMDCESHVYHLHFSADGDDNITAFDGNGIHAVEKCADGTYELKLTSNQGVLLTISALPQQFPDTGSW